MSFFWVIVVICIASLIKGISGFGFALVALPPLLLKYSPTELVPVLLICNLISSTIIVLQKKDYKPINGNFKYMIVFGAVFSIIGALTLKNISEDYILHIVSVFFIVLTILSAVSIRKPIKLSNITYKIAGVIIGFLTGCISVSGPPLALFLNSANVTNQEFRVIFAWFNVATAALAIFGYWSVELINYQTLRLVLIFTPILYIGSFIGKRLNKYIPQKTFKNGVLIITMLSSIMLFFK